MVAESPRVSVCVPTRNRSAMLRETLESVLAQTFTDFELIVTDNVSTDDTQDLVASFGDPRIRYYLNESNLGMTGNWNRAIEHARGEFIAILHDDDVWRPRFLETTVAALDRAPRAGLAMTGVAVANASLEVEREHRAFETAGVVDREALLKALAQQCVIYCPAALVRASTYREVGHYSTDVGIASEWEMWLRIALHKEVVQVPEALAIYRMGHASISAREDPSWDNMLRSELEASLVLASAHREAVRIGDRGSARLLSRELALRRALVGMWRGRLGQRKAALAAAWSAVRADALAPVHHPRALADALAASLLGRRHAGPAHPR